MRRKQSQAARRLGLAVAASALLLAPAYAQETPSGLTVFAPEAFSDAQPANALDMVRRVPGFQIVEGDEDVRGYSGAISNVRIDGEAPSKREDLGDLLGRIPASDVERIELIRGGAPGIDMGGHSVVVNIVRTTGATEQGAFEGGVLLAERTVEPLARAEYSRRWGDQRLEMALSVLPELDDDSGDGVMQVHDADGAPLEDELRRSLLIKRDVEALVTYERAFGETQAAVSAAIRGERERETGHSVSQLSADAGSSQASENVLEAELGLRVSRRFREKFEVEAVATQQLRNLEASSVEDDGADREEFLEDTQSGETIGRLELRYEQSDTLSFTTSIEGAFNFLESETTLSKNGASVLLPGANVRIEEQRAELAGAIIWRPSAAWLIEPGIRLEHSTLSETGDSTLERSFFYPKPRLSIAWDADPVTQIRVVLEREVGQLDFEDFVASASLDENVVTAGNVELAPDQTWRTSLTYERRFGENAAVVLSYHHDVITDVIDRVPIVAGADTFDAPGNIGDGVRDTVQVELTLPLSDFGIPGGRLVSTGTWRWSEVTDPTTGALRSISKEAPFEAEIEFNQDLPALAFSWGFNVVLPHQEIEYRFDRIASDRDPTAFGVFAEQRFGGGWRLRAEAIDLFVNDIEESKRSFVGTRASGLVDEIEARTHLPPGAVLLTLRRNW